MRDARGRPLLGLFLLLLTTVLATSLYANLPHALGWRSLLVYVPPFRDGLDANMNDHLGGEYRNIAWALAGGRGFADPFGEPTGPTAWMPPVLPVLQAALLAVLGDVRAVAVLVVGLQDFALVFTGCFVLVAARRTATRPGGPAVALGLYVGAIWYHFHGCFQITHDTWILMLLLGVMILLADRLWARPAGAAASAGWGAFGGLAALTGPVLGAVWAALTAPALIRRPGPLAASLLAAALVVSPWVVRNYRVFHRLIPVKSNVFFELHQSHCLEPDGVLRFETGATHPYRGAGEERSRYKTLGEIRYLDEYRERFLTAVRADPFEYLAKVGNRLLAATVIYHPFSESEGGFPLLASYFLHPLPFYGLLTMLLLGDWRAERLKRIAVITYVVYLIPFVLVAYYERYALPLLGVQVLFCFWGGEALLSRPRPGGPARSGGEDSRVAAA